MIFLISRFLRKKVEKMASPKIQNIEAIKFSMPFSTSLQYGSKGHLKKGDHVLVRVIINDGSIGLGEAIDSADILGESQASIVWAVERWIAPRLEGLPLFAVEKVWDQLETISANNTAKGAVDIAIHDAQAKFLGVPLYKLMGGWRNRIPLTWIIGQTGTSEMIQEGLEAQKRGFKSFKVKIGIDPEKDIEVIRLMRQKLGDSAFIYVDANQAYSYGEARRVLPMMKDYNIAMVEDPIPNWDTRGKVKLSKEISLPILGDECVTSPLDVKKEIGLGAISVINVKTPRTGYFQSRKVIHLAEQGGIRCLIGTMVETEIGVLGSAHFGAAFRIFSYPAELTYFLKMEDTLLKNPLKIEDGTLFLPDKPGLGVDLDERKFEHYRQEK
jgi:L-alanine-DL-glutamate epimerase-like enolase superfamily enzyme